MLKTLGSDAAVNDVLAELELTGAVIVRDLIDQETIKRFNGEVMPYVERTPMRRDDFVGEGTKRTGALENLSRADIECSGFWSSRGVSQTVYQKDHFASHPSNTNTSWK